VRVLCTGAQGYLGLALVHRLAGRFDLVGVGRAARVPVSAPVPMIAADVRLAALAEHGRFDAVVHLAGGGGPGKVEADPARAWADNVAATRAVAEAARGARLLFASTIAVYGTRRAHPVAYREGDGPAPDDLYGALKAAAEEIVWLHGGTSLRLANVYGVGSGIDVGLAGAVERFARAAATGGELTVYGDGAQRIDYVHVDDVVDAFAAALLAPTLPAAINIGSGAPVSVEDLARLAAETNPAARVTSVPPPPGKIWPDRSLDISLAAEALGWRPRVPLRDGVHALCAMMR